jgi:hypothetical protein
MKCFTNAKERDFEEWAALFAVADTRFKFLGVRTPPGSKASFIEAEWRPLDILSGHSGGIQTDCVDAVKVDALPVVA